MSRKTIAAMAMLYPTLGSQFLDFKQASFPVLGRHRNFIDESILYAEIACYNRPLGLFC